MLIERRFDVTYTSGGSQVSRRHGTSGRQHRADRASCAPPSASSSACSRPCWPPLVIGRYWWVNNLVRGPMARLGEMARRVAAGDLGTRMKVERQDEMGELTEQFNRMSERLASATHELRQSGGALSQPVRERQRGHLPDRPPRRLVDLNLALAQMLGLPARRPRWRTAARCAAWPMCRRATCAASSAC
ncbi:MAG: HAMP domain-containing protein [Inhella sp.]